MAGLNKVMLIGHLGRDPEIRYTQQGMAVVNCSLATTEQWSDKNTGERQEKTEWHRIVIFGKQAETFEKYLSKGRQVYVEGRLQTSSYEKEGQTHYATDIIVSSFQFLGGRGDNQDGGGYQGGGQQGGYSRQGGQAPNSDNFQGQTSPGMAGGSTRGSNGGYAPIADDDIPF